MNELFSELFFKSVKVDVAEPIPKFSFFFFIFGDLDLLLLSNSVDGIIIEEDEIANIDTVLLGEMFHEWEEVL
jgi:hypothetical protein